jgi:hypothetical protein
MKGAHLHQTSPERPQIGLSSLPERYNCPKVGPLSAMLAICLANQAVAAPPDVASAFECRSLTPIAQPLPLTVERLEADLGLGYQAWEYDPAGISVYGFKVLHLASSRTYSSEFDATDYYYSAIIEGNINDIRYAVEQGAARVKCIPRVKGYTCLPVAHRERPMSVDLAPETKEVPGKTVTGIKVTCELGMVEGKPK